MTWPRNEEMQEWLAHPAAAQVRGATEKRLAAAKRTLLLAGLDSDDARVRAAAKDVEAMEGLLKDLKGWPNASEE